MKNVNKLKLLTLILLGILIYSCQDEFKDNNELTESISEIETSELINFKGLKVNHRFSTPVNELEYELNFSNEPVASRYNRIYNSLNIAKTGVAKKVNNSLTNDDDVDYKVILEAKERVIKQFPYQKVEEIDLVLTNTSDNLESLDLESITEEEFLAFENKRKLDSIALLNYEKDYQVKQEQQARVNFEMVQQDFPTLTETQIKDNLEVIDNYYQQNLDYVVLENIVQNGESLDRKSNNINKKAKTAVVPILIPAALFAIWGVVNYAVALNSGDQAENAANRHFTDLDGANDRRDAFRHLTLNAFLAKNYIGIIPVKSIKTGFAKFVTDYYENNGNNDVDSKEMDFHNNAIGRKIYSDNSRFMLLYISEPSNAKIESIAKDYVNYKSCFLRKFEVRDKANRNYSEIEIQTQILNESDNTVVYFKEPIAPSRLGYILEEVYEYVDCEDGDEDYEVIVDGELVCRIPSLVSRLTIIEACSKNN